MVNVLTPSGGLSAGIIKRRQLFHFLELTIEIELSKPYHCSLVLLRDRGIAEATCIVVDVLDVAQCWRAGFHADNYCITRIDIEIEARLCHRKTFGRPARS